MKTIKQNFSYLPPLGILFTVIALTALLNVKASAQESNGGEINVHNFTGHNVLCFLFADGQVHLSEAGGVQFASLNNGESAVVHAPNCTFSILLVDHQDIWHAEFQDCNSTDITFKDDTNHTTRQ